MPIPVRSGGAITRYPTVTVASSGLPGPAGPPGTPGEVWYSGAVAPPVDVGIPGDWYLNTASGDVWEKTAPTAWLLRGNIRGPAGQNGSNGSNGQPGAPGAPGAPGSAATVAVGGTVTGQPGAPANVTNTGSPQAAVFNFTVPAGVPGTNGTNGKDGKDGINGTNGDPGTPGLPGDPGAAATVAVGTTTTGPPGSQAAVTDTGTPSAAVLNFTVPAGQNGQDGAPGAPGTPGAPGPATLAPFIAKDLWYDPTRSAGISGTPVPAYNVGEALDYLNKEIPNAVQQAYLLAKRDTLRAVYALAGAAPQTTSDGVIPGFAAMTASRTVAPTSLGSGAASGATFLRGDSTWATPTATAVRTWAREPADQGLRAMIDSPGMFSGTAQLLGASTLYLFRVWLQAALPVSTYWVHVQTVGATPAAGTYGFSLFRADATGSLVAGSQTADAAGVWTATGARSIGMTSAYTPATAGYHLIGVQTGTAGTQPKVSIAAAHALANIGLAQGSNVAPNAPTCPLYGTATTGFTGLTPPPACGNVIEGGSTVCFFAGLS